MFYKKISGVGGKMSDGDVHDGDVERNSCAASEGFKAE